jgi:hypothetical protein
MAAVPRVIAPLLALLAAGSACRARPKDDRADTTTLAAAAAVPSAASHARMPPFLVNRVAYIPPQCFTRTSDPRTGGAGDARAHNPCYVCHTRSEPPNYTSDQEFQKLLSFPPPAARNPWTNLFDPPVLHAPRASDDETLAYVRRGNYFDAAGKIALRAALEALPPAWDASGNGTWDGYTPDVWFSFDDRGFDHAPDAAMSGWRAFGYYPFPGTFFPTNGSADDVLVRLDPVLQEDERGRFDRTTYEVNLAIVEALVTRSDVPIDPADEAAIGVDLDLDGRLGTAARVAFDAGGESGEATRMQYVGRARANRSKGAFFPIAPGLFPIGTEFFHTVRYLDVGAGGVVTMAARMKEVRYAKKVRWTSYRSSEKAATREAREQGRSPDRVHTVRWAGELGVLANGWLLQGFIEAADGSLRPQSYEESAYCEGCHGGIGATTDGVFSFARKIGAGGPARGWFHWSQHGLEGIPEPKRTDGQYEYSLYLAEAGAGDELRENTEVMLRFFDEGHALRPAAVKRLHDDISYLLLPSASRALDLDRAYRAIVETQSFDRGREPVLSPSRNVYADVPIGMTTGVRDAVDQRALRRAPR